MRKLCSVLLALACWWLTSAQAQEAQETEGAPGPDLDFLEYLGAWAEEDDEWLAIEEWQKDDDAKPEEDPQGSEREKDDDDDESE
jgi:hypothetical protein